MIQVNNLNFGDFILYEISYSAGTSLNYPADGGEVAFSKCLYMYTGNAEVKYTSDGSSTIRTGPGYYDHILDMTKTANGFSVIANEDSYWVCLSSSNTNLQTSFLNLNGNQSISPNSGVLVFDGSLQFNDSGNILTANQFNYISPRSYSCNVSGVAKAFVIN